MESNDCDASRREALRKAGQDYFQKALKEHAEKGKTPNVPGKKKLQQGGGFGVEGRVEAEDQDFEAVGRLIQGSKYYVLLVVYAACQAAGLVLLERCARLVKTPFLIAFWHMIPLSLVLWGLSLAGIVSLKSYSWMRLRSNLLVTLVHAIQFLSLVLGVWLQGVVFVITWICFSLISLEVAFDVQIFGKSMLRKQQLALMIGVAGFLVQASSTDASLIWGAISMLVWTIAQGGRFLLSLVERDTSTASELVKRVESMLGNSDLDEEDKMLRESAVKWEPADHMFYQHAVPAIPVLILGFLFEEAYTLAQHDLTVFQATSLLVSCMGYTILHLVSLVIGQKLQATSVLASAVFFSSHVGALILEATVAHGVPMSSFGFIIAMIGCGAAFLRRHHCQLTPAELSPPGEPTIPL
ncbi:hypothetical protein BSKO_07947 [Bryopsis sp. KO-2023]|nr:hypothetical protein BSKO_07947 [Bryopsis sp. KO-2023]